MKSTDGEMTIYTTRLHAIRVFFWPVAVAVLFCWLVVPLILPLIALWRWRTTTIEITSRRVVRKYGLLSRRSDEILLAKVESVTVQRGLVDRIIGSGDAEIRGSGGTPLVFPCMERPDEFRHQVNAAVEMNYART